VHREQVGTAVLLSITSGFVLMVIVFFLSPLVAEPVFGPGTVAWPSSAPSFDATSGRARALLQRRLDWRWMNLTEIVELIGVSVSSVALALGPRKRG
jgi:hypothetical protein